MKINIKLDPDFSYELTKLKAKYGDRMAKLNGLADSQLDYTDFIDNFIDKDVVADSSIDPNANVGHKDVVTLEHEMSKPHYKLLALNKIYYEMKKQFGKEDANKWLQLEYSRGLYLHDAPTSSTKSYCYAYTLKDLAEAFGAERKASLSREISKKFEETLRGTLTELAEIAEKRNLKGGIFKIKSLDKNHPDYIN